MVVELHPGAGDDLLDAASAYESERDHLGERFVNAVARTLDGLSKFPGKGRLLAEDEAVPGGWRAVRVVRFPYKVVYRAQSETVYVLALWHDHREPGYWHARIPAG